MDDGEARLALGIDVGGTFTKLVLMEEGGRVRCGDRLPSVAADGPEALLGRAAVRAWNLCEEAGVPRERLAGVGLGIAGLLDAERGELVTAPNLPGWDGQPIRELAARAFGRAVAVDNDANLWALGEAQLGAGRGHAVVVVLTLGTGVGGGVVEGGRVLRGARGMAAEFGHMALAVEGGPPCACGQQGCLEAYVSAAALVGRAQTWQGQGRPAPGPGLAAALARGRASAQTIGEAAATGDPLAGAVLKETGRYLGLGIANLLAAFNPDAVVVGGGVALAGTPLIEAARAAARGRAMPALVEQLEILPARCGQEGGVFGAALLALAAAAGGGRAAAPPTIRPDGAG